MSPFLKLALHAVEVLSDPRDSTGPDSASFRLHFLAPASASVLAGTATLDGLAA